MTRRILVLFLLAMMTGGVFALVFDVQVVKASGTIYIRTNGSIDPANASMQRSGDVYTLTGNIVSDADGIVVERNNIVLDGKGFTVEGARTNSSHGILLDGRSNVTVKNTRIKDFYEGIRLESSSNNSIIKNIVTNNIEYGVRLGTSNGNNLIGNSIRDNYYGVRFQSSSNNSMSGNIIANSTYYGVRLGSSSNNNSVDGNIIEGNASTYYGIQLYASSTYNTVVGNTITNNGNGIDFYDSSNYNVIDGNILTNNSNYGIRLIWKSNNNSISQNTVGSNYGGIWLESSSNYNRIIENNVTDNSYGIGLGNSINNTICRNNFVNNTVQVNDWTPGYVNFWDNGFEGNYWSNYNGTDSDYNGIGDTPYVIGLNNSDNFPLISIIPEYTSVLATVFFIAATLLAVVVHRNRLHTELLILPLSCQ